MKRNSQTRKSRLSRRRKTNLITSLALILPLLVFYEIGVLFTDVMNGADLITRGLLQLLGLNGFVLLQLGLLALLLCFVFIMRRKQKFELTQVTPVLLESLAYAVSMGTVIIVVMVNVLGVDPRLATAETGLKLANAAPGFFTRLILSAGAGVHEELVFRFAMMGGVNLFAMRVAGLKRWTALLVAILLSSLLFSLAHHVGPLGEPWRLGAFTYRFIAGILFAVIYQFRSLAVAVYTHTFYDIYVMSFPP